MNDRAALRQDQTTKPRTAMLKKQAGIRPARAAKRTLGNTAKELQQEARRASKKWSSLRRTMQRSLRKNWPRIRDFIYIRAGGHSALLRSSRYRGWIGFRRIRKEAQTFRRNNQVFKALAKPDKVIWVKPEDIASKLNYDLDLNFNDILQTDWDITRRVSLDQVPKHRSIGQRFVLGLPWLETDVFKQTYSVRFARGDIIRGTNCAEDLAAIYAGEVDALFENMKRDGFVVVRDAHGRPLSLPHVHIGRGGEIILGNNGNHRVAIAKVLGLARVPCWVRSRHEEWQKVRESVAEGLNDPSRPAFASFVTDHPDLADLFDSPTLASQ